MIKCCKSTTLVTTILIYALAAGGTGRAWAAEIDAIGPESGASAGTEQVTVGVRVVPPFVIAEPDGSYSGLTIALWEHIADQLGIAYQLEERDIQGLLDGVRIVEDTLRHAPELFAAASALTITAEREEMLDFTHPFLVTGLGIAATYTPSGLWQAFMAIFSPEFLWIVALLILLLLFWGVLAWWFERRHNPDHFGGTPAEGIGSGFWWAAVTMTTVGYGDKAPVTFAGRTVGFIWMFAGIILVSFFTASIASSLTVTRLDSRISGPQDLPHVRVGALQHSATLDYLDENRIRYQTFETISDGLRAVSEDAIDAFVHDAPIIRYYATNEFPNKVRVLPRTFNEQYYGIALPLDSPWRNDINRVMLEYIGSDEWEALNRRYLGN
ncbi:transporter substrate-binding domain-containing protein [Balneolales bacterium ANBcel1]|nr:transporter substrate-binding domain-containing protein [Balneolales bacterium ANBcel1]